MRCRPIAPDDRSAPVSTGLSTARRCAATGLTVTGLTREAGVSRSTAYRHRDDITDLNAAAQRPPAANASQRHPDPELLERLDRLAHENTVLRAEKEALANAVYALTSTGRHEREAVTELNDDERRDAGRRSTPGTNKLVVKDLLRRENASHTEMVTSGEVVRRGRTSNWSTSAEAANHPCGSLRCRRVDCSRFRFGGNDDCIADIPRAAGHDAGDDRAGTHRTAGHGANENRASVNGAIHDYRGGAAAAGDDWLTIGAARAP